MLEWLSMKPAGALILPVFFAVLLLGSCNQNMEYVDGGERLEDAPSPAAQNGSVLGPPRLDLEMVSEGDGEVPPFVKAYFMHTWVEALYGPPQNRTPNPDWASPLIDPVENRVWCTDCHVSGQVDFEKIPKIRVPLVEKYEKDRPFMIELMKKWVGRLNSDRYGAKAKLRYPVNCLTCHATDPSL